MRLAPSIPSLVGALLLLSGCELVTPFQLHGAPADGDADSDADHEASVDAEGNGPTDAEIDGDSPEVEGGPGPMTFVVQSAELVVERLCDLDGDGEADNAIADLGATRAAVTAMALGSGIQANIDDRYRHIIHFPYVEDRAGPTDPHVVLTTFRGQDTDSPADSTDDFDGHEPFWAMPEYLDECGEPRAFLREASFEGGTLTAHGGQLFIYFGIALFIDLGQAHGTVTPDGRSAEIVFCGASPIRTLGETHFPEATRDLNMLEVFSAGGAAFGLDVIEGIAPDLDLDGDGHERVVLDADFHVETCVDGDGTTIPGRSCWQDERMADAISVALRLSAVSALFADRRPGWEDDVEGSCESPPEESLFDPR